MLYINYQIVCMQFGYHFLLELGKPSPQVTILTFVPTYLEQNQQVSMNAGLEAQLNHKPSM